MRNSRGKPSACDGTRNMATADALTFVVPGTPIGKARARTVRRRGRSISYTPKKTDNYEHQVELIARAAMRTRPLLSGPVAVLVEAAFVPPGLESKRKADRARAAERLAAGWMTVRPDADNVAKSITDALRG